MADLTITAGSVGIASATTRTQLVQVGEAVTQGQPLYRSSTDDKYYKADANAAGKTAVSGIAMTAASTDGYVIMATSGSINLGATLAQGTIYVLSDTVGGIKPVADQDASDAVVILGAATSTSLLNLQVVQTGASVP